MTFSEIGLRPELLQALIDLEYETPTPIQTAVLPELLNGRDVVGQAQTGTGKTAAFALPILQRLANGRTAPQALVLTPTRELALQVTEAFEGYGRHLRPRPRVLPIYGGQPYERQIRQLKKGVDVVVGTPGRLLDLLGRGVLDLSGVTTFVADEADELLSMGFIEDIEKILAATPDTRQTTLFSATLPAEIRRLAGRYLREPVTITLAGEQRTADEIEHRLYFVNQGDKIAALTRLFEIETINSALIFTRTRASTGTLANELNSRGYTAEALSGDLTQEMRERVLGRFREGKINILVGTDVAARGLDIDDISHVFNFDLPQFPEVYVHRVGRTGRAGKAGVAISLATPRERGQIRRLEGYVRHPLIQQELPSENDIQARREAELQERMLVWLRRDRCQKEKETVAELIAAGFDPVDIAAAALKLAQSEEKKRPIEPIGELVEAGQRGGRGKQESRRRSKTAVPPQKSHEDGMIRLSLDAGRRHGVRPQDVVGAIANQADIPGKVIGAIRIEDEFTLVDVPEQFVKQVLRPADPYRIRQRPVTISRP